MMVHAVVVGDRESSDRRFEIWRVVRDYQGEVSPMRKCVFTLVVLFLQLFVCSVAMAEEAWLDGDPNAILESRSGFLQRR